MHPIHLQWANVALAGAAGKAPVAGASGALMVSNSFFSYRLPPAAPHDDAPRDAAPRDDVLLPAAPPAESPFPPPSAPAGGARRRRSSRSLHPCAWSQRPALLSAGCRVLSPR